MKSVISLPVILATVLLNGNCTKRWGGRFGSTDAGPKAPATNAREWLQRVDDENSLANGYEELPPQTEWEAITKSLRKPGKDQRAIKLRLFGEVLADDTEAATQSIRALLLTDLDNLKGYSRGECLKYLYTFSKDPAETGKWVEQSLPKADPEGDHSPTPDEIAGLLKEMS